MSEPPCHYFHFGLIVTGKTEEEHLPKLFRSLMATGACTFNVIAFTGQRRPISSQKRQLRMVGEGKIIPDRDANEIGFPAQRYLNAEPCRFVLLIDDLEYDQRPQAHEVYNRYRQVFDKILSEKDGARASVHFLVNMLEAYYLAHAQAVNEALDLNPPLEDHSGDVEAIRNPKSELKKHCPGFKEVQHGGAILERLDAEHVLVRPDTCASLRTLFAWCAKILQRYPGDALPLPEYHLQDGILSAITGPQLANLEKEQPS